MDESRTDEIKEAVVATVDQLNMWLLSELELTDLRVQLVTRSSVRSTVQKFTAQAHARLVDWDWEKIFFRKVRLKPAWMFELVQLDNPGALCFGQVNIKEDYASIEFLERQTGFDSLKGLVAQIAFQFAATVARLLGLPEVRLMNPHPDLVNYYESTLCLTRHLLLGEVQYLSRRLVP